MAAIKDKNPGIQGAMVELVTGKGLSEATAALMAQSVAENARFNMWVAISKQNHSTEEEMLSLAKRIDALETRCRAAVRDFKADGDEASLRRVLADVTSELINIRMT
jgi:hypothetical protein